MKILLISSFYPPVGLGGAEKAASLLAESLVRFGDEVVVISLHQHKEKTVENLNGVRVYRLPIDNVYWPLERGKKRSAWVKLIWHLRDMWNRRAAAQVGEILDKEKPDVVHTHVLAGFSASVWKEIKKRHIKLVHTMHDYYLLCIRSSMFLNGKVCEKRCVGCQMATSRRKSASGLIDEVVSVSGYVLNRHLQFAYFDRTSTSVIYNVLDSFTSSPGNESSQNNRALIFGYIGKIEKAKGIELLLQSVQRLSRENWRLRIAGTGMDSYVLELKKQFPDPRIEWIGFSDSKSFYESINTAIIPSVWEDPLPYVVIEALSAGKSLICSQSGGITELAALASVAKTFPPGDASSLAAIMDQALAEREKWLHGGFINEHAAYLFSAEAVVAQYRARYLD